MKTKIFLALITIISTNMSGSNNFQKDTIITQEGQVIITFIGHASLMMEYNNLVIHIDPVTKEAEYSTLPKADLVLVTHHHGDHLDFEALKLLKKDNTVVIGSVKSNNKTEIIKIETMKNGDKKTVMGLDILAVPAYNLINKRPDGSPFHPKGEGNGYIVSMKGFTIYIAGDTENTPEMKSLKNIDVAFLPMNLPYTMTPEMVADAVLAFKPKVLYPYHYGNTDTNQLITLLKSQSQTEVRIRKMK